MTPCLQHSRIYKGWGGGYKSKKSEYIRVYHRVKENSTLKNIEVTSTSENPTAPANIQSQTRKPHQYNTRTNETTFTTPENDASQLHNS